MQEYVQVLGQLVMQERAGALEVVSPGGDGAAKQLKPPPQVPRVRWEMPENPTTVHEQICSTMKVTGGREASNRVYNLHACMRWVVMFGCTVKVSKF